jgi:hypothetical protein
LRRRTSGCRAIRHGLDRFRHLCRVDPAHRPASSSRAGTAARRRALSPEQQRQVAELRATDLRVRAHEQAHISAGHGVVTSGAQYDYTTGPDGLRYAVSGEVGIDTSREQKPEANIDKGQRIQAAALAPRDPSPQDRRVAAVGAELTAEGQAELAAERQQAESPARQAGTAAYRSLNSEAAPRPA